MQVCACSFDPLERLDILVKLRTRLHVQNTLLAAKVHFLISPKNQQYTCTSTNGKRFWHPMHSKRETSLHPPNIAMPNSNCMHARALH